MAETIKADVEDMFSQRSMEFDFKDPNLQLPIELQVLEHLKGAVVSALAKDIHTETGGNNSESDKYYQQTHSRQIAELSSLTFNAEASGELYEGLHCIFLQRRTAFDKARTAMAKALGASMVEVETGPEPIYVLLYTKTKVSTKGSSSTGEQGVVINYTIINIENWQETHGKVFYEDKDS